VRVSCSEHWALDRGVIEINCYGNDYERGGTPARGAVMELGAKVIALNQRFNFSDGSVSSEVEVELCGQVVRAEISSEQAQALITHRFSAEPEISDRELGLEGDQHLFADTRDVGDFSVETLTEDVRVFGGEESDGVTIGTPPSQSPYEQSLVPSDIPPQTQSQTRLPPPPPLAGGAVKEGPKITKTDKGYPVVQTLNVSKERDKTRSL